VTAIRKHLGDFVALAVLTLVGIGTGVYIMSNQESRPRVPLLEEKPYIVNVALSDAQAVLPAQGQSVRVAGVKVGLIGKVRLHEGQAVVELMIERKYLKDLALKTDTTALLRPRTGLKDMFIELEPGHRGANLSENDTIPVANTAPDVDPDEFLSALDSDTRSYLQLLINGAGKGLDGNGDDLREVFKRLGPTNRSLKKVTGAVADRRVQMRRLITNYGSLLETLSGKDKELVRLVDESNAVFESFAAEEQNITESVSRLPGALNQTADTLTKVEAYAPVLRSSLESLRPAFRQLDTANREVLPFVREAEPIVRTEIRPFVRTARPYTRDLRPAATDLARATPDLTASFHQLNRFFNMGAHNPNGREPVSGNESTDRNRDEGYLFWLGWVAQNTNSLFSTSDASGPFRRTVGGFNCTGISETLANQPAAGAIIGLSNVVNLGLCSGSSSSPREGNDDQSGDIRRNEKGDDTKKPEGLGTELEGRQQAGKR
jgi:phospholipid/cholesterol/gamma-HCH transport system substrate-binding protein